VSADLVNLRQARKRRDRALAETLAAENRARHGQAKHAKNAETNKRAALERRLDGHRLTPDE
jgi:hypothetical protein